MKTTNERRTAFITARITPSVLREIDIICKTTCSSRAKVMLAALHVFFSNPKRKKILSPIEMRLDEIEERLSYVGQRLKMPDGQQQ